MDPDGCQALAVHPSRKYPSDGGPGVGQIADLLARLPIDDRFINADRFLRGLAFNVLIGGTDAHAKNYSLVLIGPRAQVAPLYDVASAAPYDQYERLSSPMMIGKHWRMLDVGPADWSRAGSRLGLSSGEGADIVAELRDRLPAAFERAVVSLPADVHDEANAMADRIVEHVNGSWRPALDRNPARVLPGASASDR